MSQQKTFAADLGTALRWHATSGVIEGAGDCRRFYVGRNGDWKYYSAVRFTHDWTNVGRIVSAVLSLYADDGLGPLGDLATGTPRIAVQRLTSAFTEGTGLETFGAADATNPTATAAGQVTANPSKAYLEVANIDITDIVEAMAPSTVQRRNGTVGGGAANHGLFLYGASWTDTSLFYAAVSEDAEAPLAAYKPVITLTYEYGLTVPDVPTNLTPSGGVAALTAFAGDFTDPRPTDQLQASEVQVYTGDATNTGQTVNGGTLLYNIMQEESEAAITAGRFDHVPIDLSLAVSTTYKWRARVYDQEGQASLWTDLVSFSVTNTAPNAPTLTPASGSSFASLDGVLFRGGTFSDTDGDTLLAYQVQMSAYGSGDAHWLDDEFILWDTGPRYVSSGDTDWQTVYGGASLAAGTYYWRARHWDEHATVSAWTYASIVLTSNFVVEAQNSVNVIQERPRAPWRIVIRDMGANRGPGNVVAILEDAMNVGASMLYNSPGEAHWTLGIAHPQLSVIEPRQTHYAIEFRQGDGWREVYAGLVMDFDANDTDVVFYGVDYLGLLDFVADEHYDPSNAERAASLGGSKYSGDTLSSIVTDQLQRAREVAHSPVGFIATGSIATMSETITVYSTYQPTLNFIVGLLDSHRAGTGKRTRLSVQKTGSGYEFVVQDDPGVVRDNLRLRYGELVQGYRVIPFGPQWATRVNAIGRDRNGLRIRYQTMVAEGIDESVWGRWAQPQFMDGVADANDFARRVKQAVTAASKLGKQVGLGLRSGFLQPRDGYDLLDQFPVDIEHGSVSTSAFGSGYWTAVGISWMARQQGDLTTILTLQPREDTVAPDSDLLTLQPISAQAEWQIGWASPNPLLASSRYWLDQNTGKVYERTAGATIDASITGTASTDLIHSTGHGLSADDLVRFGNLIPTNTSIDEARNYYVIASGLTADDFKFSETLGGAAFNFLYDITDGLLTEPDTYTVVNDGVMDPPPTPSPPASAPTVTSVNTQDAAGNPITRLVVTVTPQSGATYRGTFVEITNQYTGTGESAVPDWTGDTLIVFLPFGETSVFIDGVLGGVTYWARAWSVDFIGTYSSITAASTAHAVAVDTSAPGTPQSFALLGGVAGFSAQWAPSSARDLAFYEVRYAQDDGSGTGRGSNAWTYLRAKSSSIWVGNLTADERYWVQVRAVDTSGNTEDTTVSPPVAVDFLTNPEKGWTTVTSVDTTLVGSTLLDEGSVGTEHIAAAGLSALVIKAGLLRISTSDSTMADGIEVYDGSVKVGLWNETGLYVYNSDPGQPNTYTHIDDAGLTVYKAGAPVAAITPDGVNASAITFGALPGAHNIIVNSSFELAAFSTAATLDVTWTVEADWDASLYGSYTNVTSNTNDLTASFPTTS